MNYSAVGTSQIRKTGPEKVMGAAKFGADNILDDLAYACLVSATIASGRVVRIETRNAEAVPGVHFVLTHETIDPLYIPETYDGPFLPLGPGGQQKHMPMRDDRIVYDGQYIAVVVAETFEAAQEAAHLVKAEYDSEKAITFDYGKGETHEIEYLYYGLGEGHHKRGQPETAYANSPVKIEMDLHTPAMHHNPIELHATVTNWVGDQLTVYESSAWPHGLQFGISEMIGVPRENVHVVSPYCGGSFGGKVLAAPHAAICALASRRLGRPVRLQLTRAQLFYCVGQRAATQTEIKLGAERDGRVNSLIIDGIGDTPMYQDWACEPSTMASRHMYANPHMETTQYVKRTHNGPTLPMRCPGELSSMFVVESALNQLADNTGVDPVDIRRINHAERNLENGLPWSSKSLLECYDVGAEKFGWSERNSAPGSMMRDGKLIGWGMASSTYPTFRAEGNAKLRIDREGRVTVGGATHEIGTGTYTMMCQIAADTLGIDVDSVAAQLGNTKLPVNVGGAGAITAASIGPAIEAAGRNLIQRLAAIATELRVGALSSLDPSKAEGRNGAIHIGGASMTYTDILATAGRRYVEEQGSAAPGAEAQQYAMYAFGANFVEVEVDPITMWGRVSRVTGAYASGRIINPLAARSQLIGGIVFAIGSAMTEHSLRDKRTGRWVSDNFGVYHVPVQADIPDIDINFVEEVDPHVSSMGAKGIGELGGVGLNAAITHALSHATGKPMLTHLPYLPESMLLA